ncbi:cyclic nucleotide-binding domain-containing protein [Streptomyces sp. TP-A0874]|uniref:cyclic nucleotide-binding domain-containing protein n=1 Tax=Streptomyces sp. TP-A0874 TaxID=549819 RepID=UPI0008529099|nr:cyclic nucleotide-binding domain-containing protein [Streptomyces sp. TP-A0874]
MTPRLFRALPDYHRDALTSAARDVVFPQDTRIFEEGGPAENFWIIHSGTVSLDLEVPGRGRITVENLGMGDLLGWSWLFPPYTWHFGAEAFSTVRAYEFDSGRVRSLCEEDPALGYGLARSVAEILARRLETSRTKLVDLYARHGGPGL